MLNAATEILGFETVLDEVFGADQTANASAGSALYRLGLTSRIPREWETPG